MLDRESQQPVGAFFGDDPAVVLAEGTLDMLRLAYADPAPRPIGNADTRSPTDPASHRTSGNGNGASF